MRQHRPKRSDRKIGAAPGSLVHIGEKKIDQARVRFIDYDSASITESRDIKIEKALALCDSSHSGWLNIDGLHDTQLIARIGDHFSIHPLTLEDILNTAQRPKWEDFGHYIYLVLRMLHLDPHNRAISSEQVSLIITSGVLISFQESQGDVFAPVRERLNKGQGRIRKSGSDYLAYTLLDAVVDHYFAILDHLGADIDDLEVQILTQPEPDLLKHLHRLKGEVILLRRQIWPLREVIIGLSKDGPSLISDPTLTFLRDVYDHTIQIIDTLESYRDLLSGLMDLYLTTVSYKMNEVMKVLTIMASLFIPLTFVVGVYGMNFRYMPELNWPWGYGAVWLVMVILAVVMVVVFKKKKWI